MQTIADKKSIGYFKLATFCPISMTWKDGKKAFSTEAEAMAAAKKTGKYRISHVQQNGRTDKEPFSK